MKRKLLLAAIAVCVIAVIACGTSAYFTDAKTKTNKFMTASYDPSNPDNPPKPDDIFSIVVNEDGTATADELKADPALVVGKENKDKDNNVLGLDYEDILPGSKAVKKVSITNTGDYSAYVRVKVTISNADSWYKIDNSSNLLAKLADIDTTNWTYVSGANDGKSNTVTYVYNYNTALAPDAPTSNLFSKITIPATLTKEQFATVDGFTVSIIGEAIQSENTANTVAGAFALIDAK